jgi:glycosyltransferase involved in cell wall biosynthesis
MRILEVITPSRIGGAETHVTALAQALAARGDAVQVFCPAGRPFVAYLAERGITPLSWTTTGKVDPVTTLRLVEIIRAERMELVHAHLSTAAFLGGIAARMAGVPCVATVHGFTSVLWYRPAHRLIAVSEAVKMHLLHQGIPEERVRVVHNGVALERFSPAPPAAAKRALGLDPDLPVAGIVGRLSAEKGQAVALAAWARVAEAHPGARLLLVGDGDAAETCLALAAELGIADLVTFTGFQADPTPYLAACDVVLMPSLREGLGLAALEAMALERPVVASRTGGIPEAVRDGETGLLVPPDDAAALADAILTLFADPARCTAYGQAGRARVAAHFNAETQFCLLRAVLTDCLGLTG